MLPHLSVVLQEVSKRVILPTQLMFSNHMAAAGKASSHHFSTQTLSTELLSSSMHLVAAASYLTDA